MFNMIRPTEQLLSRHVFHGSALTHDNVVKVITLSYWRPSSSTTRNSENPQPINANFCSIDYVDQISKQVISVGWAVAAPTSTKNNFHVPSFYFFWFMKLVPSLNGRSKIRMRIMTQTMRNYRRICLLISLIKTSVRNFSAREPYRPGPVKGAKFMLVPFFGFHAAYNRQWTRKTHII